MSALRFQRIRTAAAALAAAALLTLGHTPAPAAGAGEATVATFDSLTTIRSDRSLPQGGRAIAQLSAAGNEFESFQVAVQAGTAALEGLRLEPEGSLSGPGGAEIPASAMRVYREVDYQVSQRSDAEGDTGSWPDALIPERDAFYGEDRNAFPVDLAAGQRVVAWVDLLVPHGAAAGRYEGSIVISGVDGEVARVPVSLTVQPFSLPSTPTLGSLFHVEGISLPGGDQTLYAVAGLNNRVTLANMWPFPESRFVSTILPLLQGTDPRVELAGAKLTALDAYHCASNCLAPWRDLARKYPVVGERFVDYICDEPYTAEAWSDCHATAAAAEAIWPGVRKLVTTDAASAPSWATDLSPLVNDLEREGLSPYRAWDAGDAERNLWPYTSCRSFSCGTAESPENQGWPGYAIDQPASQARAMGWLAFVSGAKGELYYNTTRALSTAWSDQYRSGGNGDGTLFYPGTTEVIGGTHPIPVESMRLKRIRDGREDYEYLHLLASQGRAHDAAAIAQQLFPSHRQATISPAALAAVREQLAAMLGGAPYTPPPAAPVSYAGGQGAAAPQGAADTTPPQVRIVAGPVRRTRDRTPTFRLASSESGTEFRCRQDRGPWRSCAHRVRLKRLGYGRHRFAVHARDAAGNWARAPHTRRFRVVGLSVAGRSARR